MPLLSDCFNVCVGTVSDLPVSREFINDSNGTIFGNTKEQLADCIMRFINDESLAAKRGEAAYNWLIKKHDIENVFSPYKEIYRIKY